MGMGCDKVHASDFFGFADSGNSKVLATFISEFLMSELCVFMTGAYRHIWN
jgi:hypothetical protein